ncbi:MAG: porin [Thermoguttaceae bacterium]
MHKCVSTWGICFMAVALVTVTTELRAQDRTATGADSQLTADVQTASNPDRPPAPTAEDVANADLQKRVSELEKKLAEYAKANAAAKTAASAKPLVTPSGRLQMDVANYTQNQTSVDQIGDMPNAVGFRRARLALLGGYETIDYIVEMDFANRASAAAINTKDQSTAFKDVFIQIRDLPWLGVVRVGHFKECFGLEDLTSDNYTTFMERSPCDEGAFCPGRNNGIMAYNWNEAQRATWAIGAFTNQTNYDQPPLFQYDHWGIDMAARATYLPWYDEASNGRGLLHTGVDYAYRSAPDNRMSFSSKPESGFATSVINFTLTDVDYWQVADAEAALVYGPLSIQSEFFGGAIERTNGANNNIYGCYAYVSYFLTGENRPYNRKLGVFDRVRPYENFFRVRTCDGQTATGIGAWELGYRFSYVDTLADGITAKGAGRVADHTFGLTWYLNPFARVMFNYVHSQDTYNTAANTTVSGGSINVFETRFAMDF